MGLTYAIPIVNWIFGNLLSKNISFIFFINFKLLIYYINNIVKISEKCQKEKKCK